MLMKTALTTHDRGMKLEVLTPFLWILNVNSAVDSEILGLEERIVN